MTYQVITKHDVVIAIDVETGPLLPVHGRDLSRSDLCKIGFPPVRAECLLPSHDSQWESYDYNRLLLAGRPARSYPKRIPITRHFGEQIRLARLMPIMIPPLQHRIHG